MAGEEQQVSNDPEGISEDELRSIIGEELDSKLEAFAEKLNPASLLEGIKEAISSSGSSEGDTPSDDSLLEKIGVMMDEKIKGLASGSNGGEKKERVPKLRVF